MIVVTSYRPNVACPACQEHVGQADPACDHCNAIYHPACAGMRVRPCGCASSDDEVDAARARVADSLRERAKRATRFATLSAIDAEAHSAGILHREVLPSYSDAVSHAYKAWNVRTIGTYALMSDTQSRVVGRTDEVEVEADHAIVRACREALVVALDGDQDDVDEQAQALPRAIEQAAWDRWPTCDEAGYMLHDPTNESEADELAYALVEHGHVEEEDHKRCKRFMRALVGMHLSTWITVRGARRRACPTRAQLARLRALAEGWAEPHDARRLLRLAVGAL